MQKMESFVVGNMFISKDELKKGLKTCQWQINEANVQNGIKIDATFLEQLCVNPVNYDVPLQEMVTLEWHVRCKIKLK
jgi:hypothetical protein